MKNSKVAVVILNFNGWRDTIKCLQSFARQTYRNYQIILIDNGSSDESIGKLTPLVDKKTVLIKNPENVGVSLGFAQGIDYAIKGGFEYVALLNNDAHTEPDWLKNLVKILESKPDVAVVTGLLLTADGKRIDGAGDLYSKWGIPALRNNEEPADTAPESGYVFGATGGASLYRTKLFTEIGNFDAKYYAYDEDVDISFRIQLAGYKIWYEKSAVAYHKHGATSKRIGNGFVEHQLFRNLPTLFIKNVPFPLTLTIGVRFWFLYWAFLVWTTKKGQFIPSVKGIIDSFALYPHAFAERRRIQRSKKVDHKYIKSLLYPKIPLRSARKIEKFFHVKLQRKDRF